MNRLVGSVIASSAAMLFTAGTAVAQDSKPADEAASKEAPKTVKCVGINGCKGQGKCGMPGAHGCAGQNACKGKGWVVVPAKECKEKGGKPLAAVKAKAKDEKK